MRESELLSRIMERSRGLRERFPQVIVGPGDDCAVVKAAGGGQLVVTVDQLIEGRHFVGGGRTPVDLIARKAVARSVSDNAAMGARPCWSLATAALSPSYAHADALFDAMARWTTHWGAPLVGGDTATTKADGPMVLTVMMAGVMPGGRRPVLRSGARVGDEVWVSGRIGGSFASGRHLTFEPRLDEATWLSEHLGDDLHAMIDVSDGLGRDAARIAEASGVLIELESARVPLHTDVHDPIAAAAAGEDYELFFAAAPGAMDSVAIGATPQSRNGLAPFTRIGRVRSGAGCEIVHEGGRIDAGSLGWDH